MPKRPIRRIVHRLTAPYRRYRILRRGRFFTDSPVYAKLVARVLESKDPHLAAIRHELIRHAANVRRFSDIMKHGTSSAFVVEMDRFRSALARWRLAIQPEIQEMAFQRAMYQIGLLNTSGNRVLRKEIRKSCENFDFDRVSESERLLERKLRKMLPERKLIQFSHSYSSNIAFLYAKLSSMNIRDMPFKDSARTP